MNLTKLVKLNTDRGVVYVNPHYVTRVEAPNPHWVLIHLQGETHPLSVNATNHPVEKILQALADQLETP